MDWTRSEYVLTKQNWRKDRLDIHLTSKERRDYTHVTCPVTGVSKWCVFGIDGWQDPLIPSSSEASGTTRTWTHGRSFYEYYQR